MSERLPYEEQLQQQWHDLPLPDENKAWADMKRRLDDDDDDGVVVAWWRRGCGLWGLLLVGLLALGWLWLKPHRWLSSRSNSDVPQVITQNDTAGSKSSNATGKDTVSLTTPGTGRQPSNDNTPATANDNNNTDNTPATTGEPIPGSQTTTTGNQTAKPAGATNNESEITVTPGARTSRKKQTTGNNPSTGITGNRPRITKSKNNNNNNNNEIVESPANDKPVVQENDRQTPSPVKNNGDSVPSKPVNDNKNTIDSLPVKQQPDSVKPPPVANTKTDSAATKPADKAKKAKEKKPFFFSGGVALQQQIPVAGQTASPYNAAGRKGSLRDYIPSVYLRFNKKDRWFFQGEFRYGAPQYNKPLVYEQVSVLDTAGPRNHTINTSNQVLKTYYHQLPFTFHHYLLPNWSLGAGVVWNKFNGAITEQQRTSRNITTQVVDSFSSKIVKVSNDSSTVFSKSYFQAVFETQYQYKRFSLGVRYAFGLQPYIRFTIPGLAPREEKNSSLQLFLRYQLWKSKEK